MDVEMCRPTSPTTLSRLCVGACASVGSSLPARIAMAAGPACNDGGMEGRTSTVPSEAFLRLLDTVAESAIFTVLRTVLNSPGLRPET